MSKNLIYTLAAVLFATLYFFTAFLFKENRHTEVLPVKSVKALPEFQVQDIAEIELSYGNHKIKLVRGEDLWILQAPDKPHVVADPAKVLLLLDDLAQAKLLRELFIVQEKDAASLLLGDSDQRNTAGCNVILRDKQGREVRNMMLGKIHYSVGEQIGKYRTNIPDGRYVRFKLGGEMYYFLISRPVTDSIPLSAFWINPIHCPNMGTPLLIQYTDLKTNKTIWKVELTLNDYKLTVPDGKRLDVKAMQDKFGFLFQAPLSRDVAPADWTFTPDSRLDIVYANGFSYSLEMQNDLYDEWKRCGRLTPAYDPARTMQMKGETDAAFQKRKEQYLAELKREQRLFKDLVFILRPSLINIFETIPQK